MSIRDILGKEGPKAAPKPPPLPKGLHEVVEEVDVGRTVMAQMKESYSEGATDISRTTELPVEEVIKGVADTYGQTAYEQDSYGTEAYGQNDYNQSSYADNSYASNSVVTDVPGTQSRMDELNSRVYINGGMISVGLGVYARSSMDGLYYHAYVTDFTSEIAVVRFFDGISEQAYLPKLYTEEDAIKKMQLFSNWDNRGSFYPAKATAVDSGTITVSYDSNPEIIERVSKDQVRFAPW